MRAAWRRILPDSYVAESVVMLVLGKPQEAERAARQALALDAENEAAGDRLTLSGCRGRWRKVLRKLRRVWIIGKEPGKSMDSLVGWDAGASTWRGA